MARALSEHCIYTILHKDKLEAAARGSPGHVPGIDSLADRAGSLEAGP